MQIRLPGARHLLRARYFKKYPAGRYQVKDMVQYTSNGVGTHAMRLRINCPPEIVVVTLRRGRW
jgi:predicted MPP superfamily phosphohydrolase